MKSAWLEGATPDGGATVRLREMKRADMAAIMVLEEELFP